MTKLNQIQTTEGIWRLCLASALMLLWSSNIVWARSDDSEFNEQKPMKIEIVAGEEILEAELENNAAAREFAEMLPLELKLKDYAQIEKVSDLPGNLSTAGCPSGHKASAGDITYYAPWGNLAIFTGEFSYASGLVYLGKINSGMEFLNVPGVISVTIRKAD